MTSIYRESSSAPARGASGASFFPSKSWVSDLLTEDPASTRAGGDLGGDPRRARKKKLGASPLSRARFCKRHETKTISWGASLGEGAGNFGSFARTPCMNLSPYCEFGFIAVSRSTLEARARAPTNTKGRHTHTYTKRGWYVGPCPPVLPGCLARREPKVREGRAAAGRRPRVRDARARVRACAVTAAAGGRGRTFCTVRVRDRVRVRALGLGSGLGSGLG